MTKDRKWASPLTGIVIVIGWWALTAGLYGVSATLYAGGKMSADAFSTSTRLFFGALLLPIIPVLAFLLYWYRRNLRIAWGYAWPALVVALIIALPPAAASYASNILVTLLAIILAVIMMYIFSLRLADHRQLMSRGILKLRARIWSRQPREPWQYDFIEHLEDESTRPYTEMPAAAEDPFLVYKVQDARSATEIGEAIFEHPPHRGDAVIEFPITGIHETVTSVRLEGNYGIMDRFEDKDGTDRITDFQPNSGNKVRFEIRVNQQKIWEDELSDFGWRRMEEGPFDPQGGSLTVELRTNAMDQTSCNWAAWGELKLVEQV